MNYDVIILGGGPAGIASAIILSRAGVSTALIEKNVYPREKTCAGILTQKAIYLLEEKFSLSKIDQTFSTNQVSIMYQRKNMEKFSTQFPFVLIERNIFDLTLLNICRKEGTHVIEGLTTTKFLPDQNKILLSNGQSFTYKCLIIADGVHSPARKALNLEALPAAFCIQDTMKRCQCPAPLKQLQEVQLNFGDIPLGYSWIVPYQEHVAVGTGIFTNQLDYPNLLSKHEILCEKLGLSNLAKRRGAFVPIGGFNSQVKHPYDNIVFIGDAAGLANPLTGEGIYHALLSGYYAGKSYLLKSQEFKSTYLSLLHPTIEQLAEQKSLLPRFYNQTLLENVFFQFKDYPEYLAAICDDVISLEKRSYHSLIMELQQFLR